MGSLEQSSFTVPQKSLLERVDFATLSSEPTLVYSVRNAPLSKIVTNGILNNDCSVNDLSILLSQQGGPLLLIVVYYTKVYTRLGTNSVSDLSPN